MKWLLVTCVALAGCFDSLISDPCQHGYTLSDGHCVARETTPDAGSTGGTDAPVVISLIDASVAMCTADTVNDPNNCGACGVVCPSGLCSDSACVGAISGHIVAIGHDYAHYHSTMARVLADAVALGIHHDVAVARWQGSSPAAAYAGTASALASGMSAIPRPWHWVAMPSAPAPLNGIDVVLVDAQLGDGDALQATGDAWHAAFDTFLARGGVIVVLEGPTTASYRLAAGAGLYSITAPTDSSGGIALVTAANDAVTQQVVSPYAAEAGTVALPAIPSPVIEDTNGAPIVAHLIR